MVVSVPAYSLLGLWCNCTLEDVRVSYQVTVGSDSLMKDTSFELRRYALMKFLCSEFLFLLHDEQKCLCCLLYNERLLSQFITVLVFRAAYFWVQCTRMCVCVCVCVSHTCGSTDTFCGALTRYDFTCAIKHKTAVASGKTKPCYFQAFHPTGIMDCTNSSLCLLVFIFLLKHWLVDTNTFLYSRALKLIFPLFLDIPICLFPFGLQVGMYKCAGFWYFVVLPLFKGDIPFNSLFIKYILQYSQLAVGILRYSLGILSLSVSLVNLFATMT